MNIDESILSKLTDKQKKRVEAAATPEECLALAKEFGYELTSEQLESISGGWCDSYCTTFYYCWTDEGPFSKK